MLAELARTVTIAQASRRAGTHVNTIRRWIETGRIHAVETPLGKVVDSESLEEFLRSRAARAIANAASL